METIIKMEQVIYKFTVSYIPNMMRFKSGRIMKVIRWDTQNEKPCFWAVVDKDDQREYQVDTYYTGDHPVIGDFDRIGTTLHDYGQYILHHVLKEIEPIT
jgi:hypothetical protein